jgi:hypothetical protein
LPSVAIWEPIMVVFNMVKLSLLFHPEVETVYSSEKFVSIYETSWRHVAEDRNIDIITTIG